MTILSSIIMFGTKNLTSSTLKYLLVYLFVLIYYMNNFFNVLGKTENYQFIFLFGYQYYYL